MPINSRRFVYGRLLIPGNLFVNDRCWPTDSILVIFVIVYGDHTGVAYSNSGLTYGCESI